jgi:hypothetical protein
LVVSSTRPHLTLGDASADSTEPSSRFGENNKSVTTPAGFFVRGSKGLRRDPHTKCAGNVLPCEKTDVLISDAAGTIARRNAQYAFSMAHQHQSKRNQTTQCELQSKSIAEGRARGQHCLGQQRFGTALAGRCWKSCVLYAESDRAQLYFQRIQPHCAGKYRLLLLAAS